MGPNSAPDFSRNVHCLLGLPFDIIGLASAVASVEQAVRDRKPLFISTPNLNFLIASQTDTNFRDSVIHSELSLADGMPVVWLARILGIPISERVAGSTLFEALRSRADSPQTRLVSVYFFGGPDGVAKAAGNRLNQTSAASMRCVGTQSPGFGSILDMSDSATISHINESGADFVVVSLGARKGQAWIEHNRASLQAPVISHLGAVVNMVAGAIERAPVWMQRTGLEWLWRIKEEPTLWRRYFDDGIALLRLLFTRILPLAWINRRFSPSASQIRAAHLTLHESADEVQITLSGPWVAGNLERLREAFERAAARQQAVKLDLSALTFADSAFFGLLLLLHGHQHRAGLPLYIVSASCIARQLAYFAGVSYLLGAEK
ncbi:MAG: WecB/TagA/CpsF family glycosyltransferase [Burkholderiales bacterium]|nr:WecB/TagA/CpsF family glycosyltransferase [Burkholderiales bacterium]